MKQIINLKIIAIITVIAFSSPVLADIVKLNESEMGEIVAQAGLSITAEDTIQLSTGIKTFAFGDSDGAGKGTTAGWLSLNDIDLDGYVKLHNPLRIDLSTQSSLSGEKLTGIDFRMDGLTVAIDSMTIDSITLGGAPGEGKSFGSFAMSGMRTEITGQVRIWSD